MYQRVVNECKTNVINVYKFYWCFIFVLITLVGILGIEWILTLLLVPFLVGFVTWNIVEYVLHRWAFHTNAPTRPWNYLTFELHTYHHAHAKEICYIPVPLGLTIPIVSALMGIFYLISLNAQFMIFATVTVTLNYLYFEWIHNRIHTKSPVNRVERGIHHYHLHHHYGNQFQNFGLTYPFIDIILGTACFKKD